jgi:hypothetical protein
MAATAYAACSNLEYRFGHSGEKVASEIYFERVPPIEKLILLTMVLGDHPKAAIGDQVKSGHREKA